MSRLDVRFADCARDNRAALVTYICAGDPDFDTSLELLQGLPAAGADIIELGMPFSDPTADGPTIQAAAWSSCLPISTIVFSLELPILWRRLLLISSPPRLESV